MISNKMSMAKLAFVSVIWMLMAVIWMLKHQGISTHNADQHQTVPQISSYQQFYARLQHLPFQCNEDTTALYWTINTISMISSAIKIHPILCASIFSSSLPSSLPSQTAYGNVDEVNPSQTHHMPNRFFPAYVNTWNSMFLSTFTSGNTTAYSCTISQSIYMPSAGCIRI